MATFGDNGGGFGLPPPYAAPLEEPTAEQWPPPDWFSGTKDEGAIGTPSGLAEAPQLAPDPFPPPSWGFGQAEQPAPPAPTLGFPSMAPPQLEQAPTGPSYAQPMPSLPGAYPWGEQKLPEESEPFAPSMQQPAAAPMMSDQEAFAQEVDRQTELDPVAFAREQAMRESERQRIEDEASADARALSMCSGSSTPSTRKYSCCQAALAMSDSPAFT